MKILQLLRWHKICMKNQIKLFIKIKIEVQFKRAGVNKEIYLYFVIDNTLWYNMKYKNEWALWSLVRLLCSKKKQNYS